MGANHDCELSVLTQRNREHKQEFGLIYRMAGQVEICTFCAGYLVTRKVSNEQQARNVAVATNFSSLQNPHYQDLSVSS